MCVAGSVSVGVWPVTNDKRASTSYIQRKLSIGYNRAARLIERMENEGLVGPPDKTGKRDIYID